MFTHIFTYSCGFISGYMFNYIYKVYKNYKIHKDIKETIAREIYTYISDKLLNIIVKDIKLDNFDFINNINGINNIYDIKKLIDNIINISKEHNKSYKLMIDNGKIQINLLNNDYITNDDFENLCKFITTNNINLHIVKHDILEPELQNNIDYKREKID